MRKTPLVPGQIYHIYNRGVNRQPIFFQTRNWGYFIERLQKYCVPTLIEILAYCLMPNHYHLLARVIGEDVGQQVMQPLTVSYAKSINEQEGRSGHLFQGPFQAKLVDRDEYLKWLSRYIHLNPVVAGLVERPEEWAFSSYRDYVGLRNGTLP